MAEASGREEAGLIHLAFHILRPAYSFFCLTGFTGVTGAFSLAVATSHSKTCLEALILAGTVVLFVFGVVFAAARATVEKAGSGDLQND